MTFKRLEVGVFFRIVLLFGMLCAALYSLQKLTWLQVVTSTIFILLQIWELSRFVTRSNNEIARFFRSVISRDFSQKYSEHGSSELQALHKSFNEINFTFKQLHIEKELQFRYLQTILQLVDTGIIAFDEEGNVEWMNDAFKRTFQLPYIKNIQALKIRNLELYNLITDISAHQNQIIKIKIKEYTLQLVFSNSSFKIEDGHMTLIAVKNVSYTIDQAETEAWQKLLRVMTHEIMNSIAPISSLSDSMLRNLRLERVKMPLTALNKESRNQELLNDSEEVLQVIQNRSEGLLRFAQVYRNLSKFNEIMLTTVYVEELFNSISRLLKPKMEQQGIKLLFKVSSPHLTLKADQHLLEQVLINLIVNAERAVKNKPAPAISLSTSVKENGNLIIEVADNGSGIPEDMLESIFIPFFSGHKDGSGIGLTLAKQIIHLHKASIIVKSTEGIGTVFEILFLP